MCPYRVQGVIKSSELVGSGQFYKNTEVNVSFGFDRSNRQYLRQDFKIYNLCLKKSSVHQDQMIAKLYTLSIYKQQIRSFQTLFEAHIVQ